ncbi:hypothetical protein ABZ840_06570 [Streptomyces sp. NPDC047117]|uniref:hypothetical protein n=1 Tax=Streptomyces sp. NPDC047117 TaxID=3155379 RepID=UPI0033E8F85D
MSDTGVSLRAVPVRQAQRRRPWTAVERQGLALRFILIIGDERLTEALRIVCDHDAVTVDFPEATVRVGLSRLLPEESGVVLDCRASYRSDDLGPYGNPKESTYESPHETTRRWQRTLTGPPGAPHQREALLQEILAGRTRVPRPARTRLSTPLPLKDVQ